MPYFKVLSQDMPEGKPQNPSLNSQSQGQDPNPGPSKCYCIVMH